MKRQLGVIPGRRPRVRASRPEDRLRGEPGTHFPEVCVHRFRAASLRSAPGMTIFVQGAQSSTISEYRSVKNQEYGRVYEWEDAKEQSRRRRPGCPGAAGMA